jgi:membrane protein required for colicin V production
VPFTWVDWAIVAIIAISALISLSRGFVKEALSLLTWIVAGVVAWMFGGSLAVYLAGYIETPSARVIAGCAIMFIATLLVGAMVNYLIGELIRVTGLSGTDRFLGMAFGAARGALLVVVAVGLLSLGPVQQDAWWQSRVSCQNFYWLQIGPRTSYWGGAVSGWPAVSAYPLIFRSRNISCPATRRSK